MKTVDISMRDGEGLWLKEKIIQIQQNLAYTKKKILIQFNKNKTK